MNEAEIFGRYIIGETPSRQVRERYEKFLERTATKVSHKDQCIVEFARKHPWAIGPIDAYAALFRPHAEIHRRLFVMFAVAEATPEYAEKFLPKDQGFLHLFTIAGVSLRAGFRAITGLIIVQFIGAKK